MNLWQSLSGMVEVELTSPEVPRSLAAINDLGIPVRSLQWKDELTCTFRITRNHYRKLKQWSAKRGETLRLCKRLGFFWTGAALLGRPVLVMGFLLFLTLSVWLPGRILFVNVEGNRVVADRRILEAAKRQGVTFLASRRELRSERIKNGLLSEVPELQWVGVNTAGCVATVSVRERSAVEPEKNTAQVSRIVADTDGYILSGTVARGTGLFQPGQTVRKGQTLISGYQDCGYCIRTVRAEGEILAQTNRSLTVITPETCWVRVRQLGVKRKISLLLRKKRINLWKDSGISDTTCGRMYEEYYITLPGGFRLPAALCVETYTLWDTVQAASDPEQMQNRLQADSHRYLREQMIAGSIRSSSETFTQEHGLLILRGRYVCQEMIGREQPEQIGETNGKNN